MTQCPPTSSPTDEWRDVEGYEGIYQVSSHGRIRSLDRTVPHRRYGQQFVRGRTMNPAVAASGYLYLALNRGGKAKSYAVHALVAKHFCPQPEGCGEVRHLDGNPLNNMATNLKWGTRSENMRDRIRHGTDRNAAKTECVNGHKFDQANTRVSPNGHRHCRTCTRINQRNYRARVARKHIREDA